MGGGGGGRPVDGFGLFAMVVVAPQRSKDKVYVLLPRIAQHVRVSVVVVAIVVVNTTLCDCGLFCCCCGCCGAAGWRVCWQLAAELLVEGSELCFRFRCFVRRTMRRRNPELYQMAFPVRMGVLVRYLPCGGRDEMLLLL